MTKFTIEKEIAADRRTVWKKLADFGGVSRFHPMVETSVLTTAKQEGVGTGRTCTFYNGKGEVHEEITAWEEGKVMTIAMKGGTMPIQKALFHFQLSDAGEKTKLTLVGEFQMKGGVLGAIAGPVMMKPMMKKMLTDVLVGLETHIATGKSIGYKGKLEEAPG